MTNNNKRIAAIAATGITIVSPIAQITTVFANEVDDAQTELKKDLKLKLVKLMPKPL